MYSRYAESKRWRVEMLSANESEQGGYKEVIVKVSGDGVYGQLKFESGGHRVQRVPKTESQGRIHTSACTVAVMPELPESEMPEINPADLRIDTYRSSGAGGQHVNTTDSAYVLPTFQQVLWWNVRMSVHNIKIKLKQCLYWLHVLLSGARTSSSRASRYPP